LNQTIEKLRELRTIFDEIRSRTEQVPAGVAQAQSHGPEAIGNCWAIEMLWERVDLLSSKLQGELQLRTTLNISARPRQLHS
jgi:hypothetical protein